MTRGSDLYVCVSTFPAGDAAEAVAAKLVEEGLVACAQVGGEPILSLYRWRGELCREREVRLTLKIVGDRWDACAARLQELHPYDVPQIMAWRADHVTAEYARWACGEAT
jgi:periplasmic divalent cation tolerance protein